MVQTIGDVVTEGVAEVTVRQLGDASEAPNLPW